MGGHLLNDRSVVELKAILKWWHSDSRKNFHRRSRPYDAGPRTPTFTVARIVRSLSRGNVVTGAPEYDTYLISLVLTPPAAWAAGVAYVDGDKVTYLGTEYEVKVGGAHTSTVATNPVAWPANWIQSTDLLSAGIYHYEGDLLEASPWFQVADTVLVKLTGGEYDILETVTRVEYIKNENTAIEERIYSLNWRENSSEEADDYGLVAVYA